MDSLEIIDVVTFKFTGSCKILQLYSELNFSILVIPSIFILNLTSHLFSTGLS